ncbi:LAFA_0A02586g1_1 [Lachancea sp. 'fantastica']|nr:LAFA_0A02586g1_1 [Lachancea sp. 'fantastica']
MEEELTRKELLEKLEKLNHEINEYFDLDLERAKKRFRLVRYGTKLAVVDKIAEKTAAIDNWRLNLRTNFGIAESRFRKIWEALQNNMELDLCAVKDSLGNMRIFQVQKLGATVENVSLSCNEIKAIDENFEEFKSTLQALNVSEQSYRDYLHWLRVLCGGWSDVYEQLPKIVWNHNKYQWVGNTYRVSVAPRNMNSYAAYCKFFARLGVCTNSNCRFAHDPRTVSICRDFFTTGHCKYGDNCRLTHPPGNEYVLPDCPKHAVGECEFEVGAEQEFKIQKSTEPRKHCQYVHTKTRDSRYPICRQFAHIGYCYRGLSCLFPHLMKCPDAHYTQRCFLMHCKYPHSENENPPRDPVCLSLAEIPIEKYLLPPLRKKDSRTTSITAPSWYGLRPSQATTSVSVGAERNDFSGDPSHLQLTLGSSEDDEVEQDESSSSPDTSETSQYSSDDGDDMNADFIKL